MDTTNIMIFLSGLFTLGIMSWLWKETPFYRFVEHLYIGTAIGHGIVSGITRIRAFAWIPLQQGKFMVLIPLLIGLLYYAQLSNKYRYISRYPIALTVGVSIGLAVFGYVEAQIVTQISQTASLVTAGVGWDKINNLLLVLFVILAFITFFMTVEGKGPIEKPLGVATKGGRLVIMAFFGAVLANNIMSRLARVSGIMAKLLFEWLGLFF
jgi:hypothetical protein